MTRSIYVNETRYNLYATIHKGLRRAQTQLLARLGACDGSDEEELAQLMDDTRLMIDFGRRHVKHEETHIHGEIEARQPGATQRLVEDHEDHERDFQEMEAATLQIAGTAAQKRRPLLRGLYLRYSQFLGEDFEHMLEEETEVLALLHSLFSDAELAEIESRIVGSIDPDTMMKFIRIMLPAMHFPERLELVGGMKKALPPQVFAIVVDAGVKPALLAKDWQRLEAALALAA